MLTAENCQLCPRRCGVNRRSQVGVCGVGAAPKVALAALHYGEEPCLTGEKAAGAVFFSGCSLKCVYCQNYAVSQNGLGKEISTERLAQIFTELAAEGAACLDLVSPTHFVPAINDALHLAKKRGFDLPVVYNSGGYELVETIDFIAPQVDIFLPDLKYADEKSARDYSQAPDYFVFAAAAIRRMTELKGELNFFPDGRLRQGVLVRHLVLPGHRRESMEILAWLWENFGNKIGISLMRQYVPIGRAMHLPPLNRRLTTFEYESVVDYARKLGFTYGYIQSKDAATTDCIPNFDGSGV